MKIRYLSDLHLEFTDYQPEVIPSIGEDLVVLAGDIGVGTQGIRWAVKAIPDRPVIYVLGNHEFYGHDFDELIIEAKACAQGTNVHLLENDEVQIGGLRVLGCTLWTDFNCFGTERRVDAEFEAWLMMNDYRLIKRQGDLPLTTNAAAQRCHDSRAWLDQRIASAAQASKASDPLLVVTHMAPSLITINPRFAGDITNAAFHNAFDDLIRPPVRAWIHGHTHWSAQKTVNDIPLVTHQRGYPGEHTGGFDWDRLLELDL
ncbi:MAG: metallophosphoesterase [Panacagrimonas sp.]